MRVILLRHGPAGRRDASRWPDDRARPLTVGGEERTRLAVRGLARMVDSVERVLTSPLTRASQTARMVVEVLDAREFETIEALGPGGAARDVLAALRRSKAEDSVVLVGHEPDLGELAGSLLSRTSLALPLKKAGACAILFESAPGAGTGELEWLLPPRALRRLAGKKATT